MKTKIVENFEKVIYKDKESYFLNGKLLLERTFSKFNETISFVVLSSRDFDIKNIEDIVDKIGKLKSYYSIDIVFVVGNEEVLEALNNTYKDRFYKGIISERLNAPAFASFKCGLKAVSPFACCAFLIYANRKLENFNILLKMVEEKDGEIVIPVIDNKKSHPILFKKNLLKEIITLRKEKGIPYLLRRYSDKIVYLNL